MTRARILVLALLAAACSRGSQPQDAARPATAVETAVVTTANLEQGLEVVGALSARSAADVKTEYSGTVAEVLVTQWVAVQKGTPLAQLDRRELESMVRKTEAAVEAAKANVLQAQVAKNRSQREYERMLKLKEAGLVTQQNVDDVTTEKEASAARVSAAEAQLRASQEQMTRLMAKASEPRAPEQSAAPKASAPSPAPKMAAPLPRPSPTGKPVWTRSPPPAREQPQARAQPRAPAQSTPEDQ